MTELVGLLTEIYLMANSCFPSSSLLHQPSDQYRITPSQKLLFVILSFQLFTFPILSWSEFKPEITAILNSMNALRLWTLVADAPSKVISLFATIYFIYENSSFNTNPSSLSQCDRTKVISNKTVLAYRIPLRQVASDLGVSSETLRAYFF